jgi:uncharacterized membrane protein YphA (DoxX/SURF4 family)
MSSIVRRIPAVARIGLGLVFAVFGLNKLLHFLPQPPMSGPPASFFMALVATRYMLPLLGLVEAAAGVMLLSGRFVPLALTLLAPIIVNIVGFHLFVAQGGFAMTGIVLAAELYLAWVHRDAFASMLRARPEAQGLRAIPGGARPGHAPVRAASSGVA